jgi:hypothetical protein
VLGSTLFVAVATVTQMFRQSGADMWRTVWAEDGSLFYADALHEPLRNIALRPYAGYALLVPRMLASIGVHLPPERFSYFAALSSALLASVLALFVYFASAPLLRSRIRQGILAGALLLWPVLPFEISGVIANTQWVMVVPCLLAVLLPVDRPIAIAVRLAIVVLSPLSSPLCVLFVPIAILHVVRVLRRRAGLVRLIVPVAYTLASAVQILIWRTTEQTHQTTSSKAEFVADIAKLYGTRVSTEFVFGVRATEHLWDVFGYWIALISVVALAAALVWKWRRAGWASRWFMVACVVASGAIFALSLSQRADFLAAMQLVNELPYNFAGMRYQLFPAALLLLALLVPVDLPASAILDPPAPAARPESLAAEVRRQPLVVGLALVWIVVAFVPSFRLNTARSIGPDWGIGVTAAEEACVATGAIAERIPISPAPDWSAVVPCSELVG